LQKTATNGGRYPLNTGTGTRSVIASAAGRKNGVIDRVFAKLQEKQTVRIKIEVLSMDSTSVKIHPDAAGARKKNEIQS
jgi:hypothetical protein